MDFKKIAKESIRSGLKPYKFQQRGIQFIFNTNGRCLVSDEMGLGKSIQAILWCVFNPKKRPVLIICPSRLKSNWEKEFNKWLYDTAYTLQVVKTSKDKLQDVDFVVCSYDVLPTRKKLKKREHIKLSPIGKAIFDRQFRVVIIDEAHMIAESKTRRTKAIKKICKKIPHRIILTGTPLRNKPLNFFNILELIAPDKFYNWRYYVERYCDAHYNNWGMDVSGASNLSELHNRIKDLRIRRTKQDVLSELPDKQYSYIPVQINAIDENKFLDMASLRREIGIEKIPAATEFVLNFIAENPDEQLVVFAHHHAVIDGLLDRLNKKKIDAKKIDGRDSEKVYTKARTDFQNKKGPNVLIVGVTGAQGYDLHAASNALFVEFLFVPAELLQAEDRLHRLGQKNAVNIYRLVAEGTLDEHMMRVLQSKTKIIEEVIDGVAPHDLKVQAQLRQILK